MPIRARSATTGGNSSTIWTTGAQAALADLSGPDWAPRATRVVGNGDAAAMRPAGAPAAAASDDDIREATRDSIRALILIRSYRVRGHLLAQLDPLGIEQREDHPELDYETYGFTPRDLDRRIFISNYLGLGETATLREIIARCKATYAGTIGVEFMHIQDPEQKSWLQARIEAIENRTEFTTMGKKAILGSLIQPRYSRNSSTGNIPAPSVSVWTAPRRPCRRWNRSSSEAASSASRKSSSACPTAAGSTS